MLSPRRFCFLCIFLFYPLLLRAQGGTGVQLQLTDSVTEVQNESLQDITVLMVNTGTATCGGMLHLKAGEGARIATKQEIPVSLAPGERLYIPAKAYIGATTLAGDIPYSVTFTDASGKQLSAAHALLRLKPARYLRASLAESEFMMPAAGGTLRIPVHVSNRGNVPQEADIVIAYPAELQDRVNKSIRLTVPPFRDTTLYFERRVSRAMVKLDFLNISLYGIYAGGDYFSMSSGTVQYMKSRKRFGSSKSVNNFAANGNFISLGMQNAFSANESYTLQSHGDYALSPHTGLAYNISALKWKNAQMPVLVNDTWLAIRHKGFGVKAGNIIQNGELSYNGRGAEAFYFTDSLERHRIFGGYLDKTFNLFSSDGNSTFGRAAWAGYQQQGDRFRNSTTFSYDEDRYALTRSLILVNDATWHISELLFAGFKAGVANSAPMADSLQGRQSFSVAGSLNGNLSKKLSLSSDNLYASGYYPGTRRGIFSLNERLNLRLGKMMLSGGAMYSNLEPRYIRLSNLAVRNSNRSFTGELSMAASLGTFGISVAPQYVKEQGNWYNDGAMLNSTLESYRISTACSYAAIAAGQNFMLRADLGRYQTALLPGTCWQFRANLSYNYRFFKLSAIVQKGSFLLSEAFQEVLSERRSDFRVNISPMAGISLFSNKLRADGGITYYRDYYVNSLLYNGSLNLYLNTTRFYATVQYNTFSASASYRNVQIGITQLLPQAGKDDIVNKSTLNLLVYYDRNGNNRYDESDSLAAGYMASINKMLLLSDGRGRMSYTHLPAGGYRVYFPTQKGWYAPDQYVVLQPKQATEITVPLRQTGTVTGSVRYEYNELSFDTEREISGKVIKAVDADGNMFEARTDDNGLFVLYLPTGTYTITVDGLPEQIEVIAAGPQPVQVAAGQLTENLHFTLKIKQRKIEVKRFGQ